MQLQNGGDDLAIRNCLDAAKATAMRSRNRETLAFALESCLGEREIRPGISDDDAAELAAHGGVGSFFGNRS